MRIGRGFLAVARRLMENAHMEADWRSVINRCYFASYRICLEMSIGLGYRIDTTRSAHRRLIAFMQGSDDRTVHQCGGLLETLRILRQDSDYGGEGMVSRSDALNSLEDAADIIEEKLIEIMPDAE